MESYLVMRGIGMARSVVLACFVLLLWPHVAKAELITSAAGIGGSPKVVDFSQFNSPFSNALVPVQIGGLVGENITWSSSLADSVIGSGTYLLGGNGVWNSDRTFTGAIFDEAVMTYRFHDGPVSAVGGFMNYGIEDGVFVAPVLLEALDINDNVLESYDLATLAAISTPGGINEGVFRGIVRATNDIFAFRISGRGIVLDDLTFARGPVTTHAPEPGTLWLFAIGAATAGVLRRRVHPPQNGDY
jgi:hypothetical protein